jgi:hypothetical protein
LLVLVQPKADGSESGLTESGELKDVGTGPFPDIRLLQKKNRIAPAPTASVEEHLLTFLSGETNARRGNLV